MKTLHVLTHESAVFKNREEAGKWLFMELEAYKGKAPAVVGIPRGGVVIARELARLLEGDLDMIFTHKLGAPGSQEFAIGAVSQTGEVFLDETLGAMCDAVYISEEKKRQMKALQERSRSYRRLLPKISLKERIVILTDDGVATGYTMHAALSAIRKEGPKWLILALPVGPEETVEKLAELADETVCLCMPRHFDALSRFYLWFPQLEEKEILDVLRAEAQRRKQKR